jgi:tetratricopeptide (TPR) repeat protein
LSGEYPQAFDFYHKAMALSQHSGDHLNEATALRKLAVWYIDKEEYDKALQLLTKSSEINRDRQHIYQHKYNLACDYFDIALVFSDKDDFTAAKEFYRKSLVLFEEMKLQNELSDYYFNLGELHLFDKHYELALDCYLKGLRIDQKHENWPSIASGYNMIGELYMEMGNIKEAENFFNKSLLICEDIKTGPELAAVYYNLGALYKQAQDKNKSAEFLSKACDIYQKIDTPVYQRIREEMKD